MQSQAAKKDPAPPVRFFLRLCNNAAVMNTRTVFLVASVWALLVVGAVHSLQFRGSVPDFTRASGGGVLLDAVPAFTPDATYERLTGYGEEGRRNYSFRNLTIDVLLPLSVLPFLWLLIRRAASGSKLTRPLRAFLLALPFVYVAFDVLENASVLALLAEYPGRLNMLAASLPYTTVIKRAASLLALAIPLGLFGFELVRRRQLQRIEQRR
jgi:hypothetical protein